LAEKTILVKKQDNIATIIMNRPEVMNALNHTMFMEFLAALADVNQDENIRVAIITGAGKAFCASADVEYESKGKDALLPDTEIEEGIRYIRHTAQAITKAIIDLEKPTIGMINGAAVGDGFDWALACDLRVGSTNARFMNAFIRMGIAPNSGAPWLYPKLMGLTKSFELLYTGDWLKAEEANKIGLFNRLVAPEDLEKETLALAHKIAEQAPIPIRMMKRQVYQGLQTSFDVILDLAGDAEMICVKTQDHKEALAAFRAKRKPPSRENRICEQRRSIWSQSERF